jgi:hypothetical protein
MRRNLAIATGVAAGVTAVALIASPALAKAGPWSEAGNGSNATCLAAGGTGASGAGFGPGLGNGDTNGLGRRNVTPGAMGLGMPSNLATGTLTSAQKTSLAGMADEEKLAHDLYSVLAAKYPGVVQFDRIAPQYETCLRGTESPTQRPDSRTVPSRARRSSRSTTIYWPMLRTIPQH